MRAAAVAFVLIVGAAVVLWFGNTLNSWVLGGLIGGLAALLLSIPISLALFTFFSRRHEERIRAEMQEEAALAAYQYPPLPEHTQIYEAENYLASTIEEEMYEDEEEVEGELYEDERDYEFDEYPRRRPPSASLPPRLPAPRRDRKLTPAPPASFQQRDTLAPQTKKSQVQRLAPPAQMRRAQYPGLPGGREQSRRSQYLSEALRAARMEAARQQDEYESDEDIEISSMLPSTPRRPVARRSSSIHLDQSRRSRLHRTGGAGYRLSPEALNRYPLRRTGDADSGLPERRSFVERDRYDADPYEEDEAPEPRDPETQYTSRHLQRSTGSMRRQTQTGSMQRRRQTGEQRRSADLPSGSLKNPLVRRAPYLYEDDPLREEFRQRIDGPIARRSSRYSRLPEDEEDQF